MKNKTIKILSRQEIVHNKKTLQIWRVFNAFPYLGMEADRTSLYPQFILKLIDMKFQNNNALNLKALYLNRW